MVVSAEIFLAEILCTEKGMTRLACRDIANAKWTDCISGKL